MKWEVIQGESLDAMRGMADGSFALIVADPPYFKVKDDDWDNQWKTKPEFLAWIRLLCAEWQRLLKPNGSLYVFASPNLAREVGNVIAERFNILTDIRWQKPEFSTKAEMFRKEDLRSPFPASETVWFAEQFDADTEGRFVFEPLRAYLDCERKRARLDDKEARSRMGLSINGGGLLCHFWGRAQWMLPTAEQYAKLRASYPGFFTREYEDLRREYEDLRRPFNATADAPYTDVWAFPTVANYKGKHPCEKPLEMVRHIVAVSSREGDTVLDPFAGSFVLGGAALNLNRSYVGIDGSAHWCEQGRRRLSHSGEQGNITLHNLVEFKRANERTIKTERRLPLFEAVA